MSLNSIEVLCSVEEKTAVGFDKYLLSQTKRSSQGYQLWRLCMRVVQARLKAKVTAPGNAELAQKLEISPSQVRNRLSDLIAFYQEYLAILRLRSTPGLSALLALEQAIETKNEPYVSWAEKKVDRLVTKSALYNTSASYDSLRFNRVIYEWYAEKFNRVHSDKTFVLYQQLNEFILIEKCKLYLDATSITYDGGFILMRLGREITELFESRGGNTKGEAFSFAEKIYYNLFLIVKETSDASYQYIFSVLGDIFRKFAPRDVEFVLAVMTNRIANEIMTGNNELQNDYFRLVLTLLDYPKIKITEWMLKNFITVLCRMRKESLAETVLKTYLPGLPNERQENSMYYNMAIIKMSTGKLEEATKLLDQITISETTYYLGGRFILFRAMYKAKEYEGVLSLTKSFKGYVTRLKTIGAVLKSSAFYFLKYFNELVRLASNQRFMDPLVFEKRMKQLLEKVLGTDALASREWLIEEIKAYL